MSKIRYLCKSCNKSFVKDFSHNKLSVPKLARDHLIGIPFSGFSDSSSNIKKTTAFYHITHYLQTLPPNHQLTSTFCDMSKFCGKLAVDGTYLPIKNFRSELPLIWACDYESHDFPHSSLELSESYLAWRRFFAMLKRLNYPLKYLVCDDNDNIKRAARLYYPTVTIQLCLKHYLANIQKDLNIKSSDKYKDFFDIIAPIIYLNKLSPVELVWAVHDIYPVFEHDPKLYFWMSDIVKRRIELTRYLTVPNSPKTTNIIEGFNGHLKDRADNLRGFKSLNNATNWLNAYVILRRLKNFTSCGSKFKYLNGKYPLQNTIKEDLKLPDFF